MATLVLTTVGTALGGPVGGAIGALIGNQVDQRWLAPRRQGARLGALTVQTSAYGQPIPKLFGTLRVAGLVIWATDLKEDRQKSGGGKGKPKTTSYSYSASFAVALSARAIVGVGRIWADGKLLRGGAGDWKSETGFRLHSGDEGQPVDPLLAAVEGAGGTPAYRGMAYAVFEDMQLADFGNRIPSLTFEVKADAAAVPLGRIAETLSVGAVGGDGGIALDGYAAGGDSVRGALESLSRAIPFTLRDEGNRLLLVDTPTQARTIPITEFGCGADRQGADRRAVERRSAGTLPDEVTVTYYEPLRDYQPGLQRARRGGPGRRVEAIELPVALDAGTAKAVAERRLAESWADRTTASATLPWRWVDTRPDDAVVSGIGPAWRVTRWTLEKMVLKLDLRAATTNEAWLPTAQAGRAVLSSDLAHGPTRIALLDLPPLGNATTGPQLWLAAAGDLPGWRRAAVIVSMDEGISWTDAGTTALPATMGRAVTALPPGDPALFDRAAFVEIELFNDAMTLVSCTDAALVNGVNLAMLGDELIQFGEARLLGGTRWRLSSLLRGRRGSEVAVTGHARGEDFVLLDRDTLLPIAVPADRAGGIVQVIVSSLGDPVGIVAHRVVQARAVRPPAPVHLRAEPYDGGLRFAWTRRSRTDWHWNDSGEVALSEENERYNVTVTASGGPPRTIESALPFFDYTAAAIAADSGTDMALIVLSVRQFGSFGTSDQATASFTREGNKA